MKVLNVIEESRLGGPQKRIASIANALKDSSINTIVVMPSSDSEAFTSILANLDVPYKHLKIITLSSNFFVIFKYMLKFPFEILDLIRLIRSHNTDLVHVSGGVWQFKSVIASILTKTPFIWHLNDTFSPTIIKLPFWCLNFFSSAYICTSERVYEYYLNKKYVFERPTFFIQPPVDDVFFKSNFPSIVNSKVKFCMVGNINPTKDYLTALKSFSLFIDAQPNANFELHIAGNVNINQIDYYNELLEFVSTHHLSDKVYFHGQVKDVANFLSHCNVFICSSRSEAGPLSVWEAMAVGLLVISSDVGDVKKYIVPDVSGFIFPILDYAALFRCINHIFVNRSLISEYGLAAKKIASKNFSVPTIAKKTQSAYLSTGLL